MTIDIDTSRVRRLVAAKFPQWVDLPMTPVVPQGWDSRTFRLGTDLSTPSPAQTGTRWL
jgi:aminoglycoside phosphotransferase (APT) family kinase protein